MGSGTELVRLRVSDRMTTPPPPPPPAPLQPLQPMSKHAAASQPPSLSGALRSSLPPSLVSPDSWALTARYLLDSRRFTPHNAQCVLCKQPALGASTPRLHSQLHRLPQAFSIISTTAESVATIVIARPVLYHKVAHKVEQRRQLPSHVGLAVRSFVAVSCSSVLSQIAAPFIAVRAVGGRRHAARTSTTRLSISDINRLRIASRYTIAPSTQLETSSTPPSTGHSQVTLGQAGILCGATQQRRSAVEAQGPWDAGRSRSRLSRMTATDRCMWSMMLTSTRQWLTCQPHRTFLKRKGGLFKKAHELSVLCSVDVAVIIFGSNKKLYQYSSGDISEIINRHQFVSASRASGPLRFSCKD